MSTPFFSIVLPTKNRSEILPMAIDSVLNQSFADWELVVIDNDDTDATRQVISEYSESRIRYERTGGLSMWDNWEHAIACARGKYILIQEDKVAFKPGALEYLERIITPTNPDFCTWGLQAEPGLKDRRWKGIDIAAGYDEVSSRALLDSFVLQFDKSYFWRKAPRGLNSAIKKDICDKIKRISGAVCPKYSPDFTMAYQVLNSAYKGCFLHSRLSCQTTIAVKYSNGYSVRAGDHEFVKKYFGIDGFKDLVAGMPLKTCLPLNSVLADFWRLNAKLGWGYDMNAMPLADYCIAMWNDIMRSKYEFDADVEDKEKEWFSGCKELVGSSAEYDSLIEKANHLETTFDEQKRSNDYRARMAARDAKVLGVVRRAERIFGKMKMF